MVSKRGRNRRKKALTTVDCPSWSFINPGRVGWFSTREEKKIKNITENDPKGRKK